MCSLVSVLLLNGPIFGFTVSVRLMSIRRYPMCLGTLLVETLLTLVILLRLVWFCRHRLRVCRHCLVAVGLRDNCRRTVVTKFLDLRAETVEPSCGYAMQKKAGNGALLRN